MDGKRKFASGACAKSTFVVNSVTERAMEILFKAGGVHFMSFSVDN
jgi:hypothetical protein